MPVYEYQCSNGHVTDEYRTVDDRGRDAQCVYCRQTATKVILHAPRVFGDYEGYESPATGKWVEGRRQREEDMRRSGCRPYDPGDRYVVERKQKEAWEQLDAEVDAAVDMSMEALTQHDEGSDGRNNLMRG